MQLNFIMSLHRLHRRLAGLQSYNVTKNHSSVPSLVCTHARHMHSLGRVLTVDTGPKITLVITACEYIWMMLEFCGTMVVHRSAQASHSNSHQLKRVNGADQPSQKAHSASLYHPSADPANMVYPLSKFAYSFTQRLQELAIPSEYYNLQLADVDQTVFKKPKTFKKLLWMNVDYNNAALDIDLYTQSDYYTLQELRC
uniref:Protein kinase domain-containing protein n=1 Tax=Panagrellus redivivus TaxID=6233 RepID=A0A7E4VZZ7_PANRE